MVPIMNSPRAFFIFYIAKLKYFSGIFTSSITTRYPLRTLAMVSKRHKKVITKDTVNQKIVNMNFAVKGEVLLRAMKHKKEMAEGVKKPFSNVIFTNISEPHSQGQQPITFLRQVLATCVYPQLFEFSQIPDDVKKRARIILSGCGGSSLGSYTETQGIAVIRKHVAEFIMNRDNGVECNPDNIFLTDGGSHGVKLILNLLNQDIDDKKTGILLPAPGYPLYTATITELGLYPIYYYLDETKNWSINTKELSRALKESKCHSKARAMVIVNPGNPTGQVLTRKNIENAIKFAQKENLCLIADEVYQENIYDEESDFHSVKKVKHELGPPFDSMELISLTSASKGFLGECGLKGGILEFDSFDKDVIAMAVKLASVALCSNTCGQVAVSVLCKPPECGDESYEQFMREKCCILNGLMAKAKLVTNKINEIPGLKANPVQGALYSFVQIDMPEKAIAAAEQRKILPDVMWCLDILDKTGIVLVPGSGFGQRPGTYHFRTTILPSFETMKTILDALKKYQSYFIKRFVGGK